MCLLPHAADGSGSGGGDDGGNVGDDDDSGCDQPLTIYTGLAHCVLI